MAYDLEQFCADTRAVLQSGDTLPANLTRIGAKLAELLANPAFVATAFAEDTPPGQRLLHHDQATDFHVLATSSAAARAARRTATAPPGRSTAMRAVSPT